MADTEWAKESDISRERALAIMQAEGVADEWDELNDYWVCTDHDGREFLVLDGGDPVCENATNTSWLGSR